MDSNKSLGKYGEDVACKYLIDKGYNIIERNFRCRIGEADIIAMKDEWVVFIEVKTRSQIRYGTGAEAITREKKRHIYNVAEFYLTKNKLHGVPISLDVIEVYLDENGGSRLYHIRNAIIENPSYNR